MKVELEDLTFRDLVFGYHDGGERGVVGYGGLLDIRPPYQCEFIVVIRHRRGVSWENT